MGCEGHCLSGYSAVREPYIKSGSLLLAAALCFYWEKIQGEFVL